MHYFVIRLWRKYAFPGYEEWYFASTSKPSDLKLLYELEHTQCPGTPPPYDYEKQEERRLWKAEFIEWLKKQPAVTHIIFPELD
jgi:hypothetical protein